MLKHELSKRKRFLESIKNSILTHKKTCESNYLLRFSRVNGIVRCYYRDEQGNSHYIQPENTAQIREWTQSRYEHLLLPKIEKELKLIENLEEINSVDYITEDYEKQIEERKKYIAPFSVSYETLAKTWKTQPYQGTSYNQGEIAYFTSKGERVKSKSEVIIADMLNRLGLEYRYEYPLEMIDGTFVFPDFTILSRRTKSTVIFEHFGMMDNPSYATACIKKLRKYSLSGYDIGSNLLCSFECTEIPMDTRELEQLFQSHLLP